MNKPAEQYPEMSATIAAINAVYQVSPQAFLVGDHQNVAGDNLGSLAILGFAKLHSLREDQVLSMFGEVAWEVLNNPNGTNHKNIRAFLKCGLKGVSFSSGGIRLRSKLQFIKDAWEDRANITPDNLPDDLHDAVEWALDQLDVGNIRVTMKLGDNWFTNQTLKKAVLLSFRINDNRVMGETGVAGFDDSPLSFDKVSLKFRRWKEGDFSRAGFRVVPGAVVRRGSFIGKNVVLMPSFVNIGAYVGAGTMVDTWATVGSCAQIGKNCHLSGGVGIGGVLEPLQANPTIIEDNCFIGARSEVVEGVVVEENSVIGMGVYLSQSTPIVDRESGDVTYGYIPSGSVVIHGSMPMTSGLAGLQKSCAIIIKRVDAQTRAKTAINELLRS